MSAPYSQPNTPEPPDPRGRRPRFANRGATARAAQPRRDRDTPPPDLRIAPDPAPDRGPDNNDSVILVIAEHLDIKTLALYDPENHFVAALLSADTTNAAEVLAIVEDTDIQGHLPATVVRLARALVANDQEPTPQAVMARARVPVDPNDPAAPPPPTHRRLTLYTAHVYTMALPIRLWPAACQVVEDSYRRAFEHTGLRQAQMAESCADIHDLEQFKAHADHRLNTHRARLDTLHTLTHRPPTPRYHPELGPPPDTAAAIAQIA